MPKQKIYNVNPLNPHLLTLAVQIEQSDISYELCKILFAFAWLFLNIQCNRSHDYKFKSENKEFSNSCDIVCYRWL